MDMIKFVQDGIKQANKNQKTLQAIVDILFDGTVDVIVFPDSNLIYCDKTCGIENIMFNHFSVDEILTFDKVKIVTEADLNKHKIFKIAEGIYGCVDELYSFTDCSYSNNPLEPFYEYLPK